MPTPQADPVLFFNAVVHEALENASAGRRDDQELQLRLAESLENFARAVRLEVGLPKLRFCRLAQDGDDEGVMKLDRLPTAGEASAIREAIGIRKRRHLSDDAMAMGRSAPERARSWLNRPLAA